ncbi:TetR family transcriptional regulator [Streptomyces sp. NPDC048409]|uniref:TetR family transcriptional regulator n=1 Tax=Streptomyces sp. NPDC048409 TaxID=3154723 RepID=UPI00342D8952
MRERARSAEDKAQRAEDLLRAAESVAVSLGGVRFVTIAAVTEQAGLHRTGVRRYFANKEELLLALAERGWAQWRDAVTATVRGRTGLGPEQVAATLTDTLSPLSVFCDLLSHVAMHLEGDVDIERARAYKSNAFAAADGIVAELDRASSMSADQLQHLLAAAISLAAALWQASHPTPTLATLYEQVPDWGHAALDFEPRLRLLVRATAIGLSHP